MSVSFFDMLKSIFLGSSTKEDEPEEESLLHIGWQQREENFYPSLFGEPEGAPKLLTEEIFKQDFGRNAVHPFWLHHGVLTFPPTNERTTWLYATSGMSNAFDSEIEEWSGLGVEYILETAEKSDWAADKLARLMTFNLLIAAGHYKDQSDLRVGSVVRLGLPVDGNENCILRNFIALSPCTTTPEFQLVTGKVELLQMIAISDAEAEFADQEGHDALAQKLTGANHHQVIAPRRSSVI